MRPDAPQLAILATVWGLAVLAVLAGVFVDRRRLDGFRDRLNTMLARREARGRGEVAWKP